MNKKEGLRRAGTLVLIFWFVHVLAILFPSMIDLHITTSDFDDAVEAERYQLPWPYTAEEAVVPMNTAFTNYLLAIVTNLLLIGFYFAATVVAKKVGAE